MRLLPAVRSWLAFVVASVAFAYCSSAQSPTTPDTTPPGKPHFDSTGVQVGQEVPDLPVYSLKGDLTSLRKEVPGPALLLTSSYSCPQSRRQYPDAAALAHRFEKKVPTVIVYVIEAHPKGDPSPYSGVEDVTTDNLREHVLCAQPRTLEQRLTLARQFQKRLNVSVPIYADAMDDRVWKSLGGGPNMGFLIDDHGIVRARQGWFDAKSMESAVRVLSESLTTKRRQEAADVDVKTMQPAMDGDLPRLKVQIETSPDLITRVLPYQPRGGGGDRTLLHYAVQGQHAAAVEWLVSRGAGVNVQTEHAPSPLHLAARGGDVAIVKFLIAHGADVNARAQGYGPTPLQEALIWSKFEAAKALIDAGATSNLFTDVAGGNIKAVRELLAADPTLAVRPDGWGRPPLAYAAAGGKEDVATVLLKSGATDYQANDFQDERSAIWRAVNDRNVSMVRLLCKTGSNPNLLAKAVSDGSSEIVHELLVQKADPNYCDIRGFRPLHNAALNNRPEYVALLIAAGADPNAPTGKDRTPCGPFGVDSTLERPLHIAAQQGAYRVIAELLRQGAKVDSTDESGRTPLHAAAGSYKSPRELVDSVKALIGAGADVNAKDLTGMTPLMLADAARLNSDGHDDSVVKLLRTRGAVVGDRP